MTTFDYMYAEAT